jgi:tetratricopeptide (TPR) repeat protein
MNRASVLWLLGHYEEAEKLLREVEQSSPEVKSNKSVAQTSALIRAGIALSRRQLEAAEAFAGRVLTDSGPGSPAAVEAEIFLAGAMSQSGQASQAVRMSASAVESAVSTGMPDLIAASLAAKGMSLLAAGKPAEALAAAKDAAARNTATRNRERHWRILLLAARAAAASGKNAEAADYAAQAASALSEVEASFSPHEFSSYAHRPDIQNDAGLLASLRRPATTVTQVKGQSK